MTSKFHGYTSSVLADRDPEIGTGILAGGWLPLKRKIKSLINEKINLLQSHFENEHFDGK